MFLCDLRIYLQGIYANDVAFKLLGKKLVVNRKLPRVLRGSLHVMLCFVFFDAIKKMRTRLGCAAWLTSCAPVFHHQNRLLPYWGVNCWFTYILWPYNCLWKCSTYSQCPKQLVVSTGCQCYCLEHNNAHRISSV